MQQIDDTVKFENRQEVRELLTALLSIPEDKRSDSVIRMIRILDYLDMVW